MAVGKKEFEPVTAFEDWYERMEEDREGCRTFRQVAPCGAELVRRFEEYKTEHLARTANYEKYEQMADAEVVSQKPDLPNVSSGDIAGMVRRTARNVVQNTPNVEITNEFDDDGQRGILASYILRTHIIGDDLSSNDMQQNLFASTMSAFTLGFDAVCPVLIQRGDKTWAVEYDVIHYRDVIPEPGVKDVRKAPEVFVRRYLTKGELNKLIRQRTRGWDIAALKALKREGAFAPQQRESVAHQNKKHRTVPSGYEIVTWYSSTGDAFLTFSPTRKLLLNIQENKDPLMRHPVHFLVLEKDPLQPLGKSQISLVFGRQEMADLLLNGAMKLWYRNLNPTILGIGTGLNGAPNMSPGKYVSIPNPNAKLEPFEVNTQTLLQYGSISTQNQGAMINLIGAADQQMAASAGVGMSATPQGVDAQQAMVDITTNNYQKAVENFFSRYCSYALTMYFQEMSGAGKIKPTAATRKALINAGMAPEAFSEEGELELDWGDMAVEYNVRCVPGSLVEMEDEKQLRILNALFVPLSQAMPALAATQDTSIIDNAARAMQFIIRKQIELSGSTHSTELETVLVEGNTREQDSQEARFLALEESIGVLSGTLNSDNEGVASAVAQLQEQMSTLTEMQGVLLEKLGVSTPQPPGTTPTQ